MGLIAAGAEAKVTDRPGGIFVRPAEQISNEDRVLHAVARLASGVSLDAAAAAAKPIVRGPESPARRSARVIRLREDESEHAFRPLWLLFAGTALLLLVACSNVASLLLSCRARPAVRV
jgi:hypothetical protein